MAKARTPAVAYLRTSSAANVGANKDSDKRQRVAIQAFARRAGFEIVDVIVCCSGYKRTTRGGHRESVEDDPEPTFPLTG